MKKSKILILGAKGMLGTDLMKVFSEYFLVGWDMNNIDITDEEQVNKKITELSPDVVINAAAYTNVDACETNKDVCMRVNGEAVGYLAKACKKINAVLIHISTDYIFDGNNKNGYKEDSSPNPINVYGQSKLLGEKNLMKNIGRYYLIRTSWLFGINGNNFVETIIALAKEKDKLTIVNDQIGSPTYTLDLANEIKHIVEKKLPFGTYHMTNKGHCSWFEFAKEITSKTNLNTPITPTISEQFPRPAKRPKCSILLNTKYSSKMRNWKGALTHYMGERK